MSEFVFYNPFLSHNMPALLKLIFSLENGLIMPVLLKCLTFLEKQRHGGRRSMMGGYLLYNLQRLAISEFNRD